MESQPLSYLTQDFYARHPECLHASSHAARITGEFAQQHLQHLNLYELMRNEFVGEAFIETMLKMNPTLGEDTYLKLNGNASLSTAFWERHPELINWMDLSKNTNLSIDFIRRHRDNLITPMLFRYNDHLPGYLMRRALVQFLYDLRI